MRTYSRLSSFMICIFVYFIAFAAGAAYLHLFGQWHSLLYSTFIADVLATVVVYLFSQLLRNASLYDPYWSVIPMAIVCYWACMSGPLTLIHWSFLAVIWIWGIRLTLNWARGWQGLGHVDWRYSILKQQNPRSFWLVNLFGIQLFPTLMVFVGMLPVFYALFEMKIVCTWLLYIGSGIAIAAAIISFVADEQLRRFKKVASPVDNIAVGLWKYSRHPNYFGEILFWFGLWVIAVAVNTAHWWTGIGFLTMVLLFNVISIPLMEKKNLQNKAGYAAYMGSVSKLLPWCRK